MRAAGPDVAFRRHEPNFLAFLQAPVVVRSGKPGAPQLDLVKQDSAFLQGPDAKPVDKFDNRISQEYSTSLTQDGAAASFKVFGPPKPICNAARLANIEELGVMRRPKGDPQIRTSLPFQPAPSSLSSTLGCAPWNG